MLEFKSFFVCVKQTGQNGTSNEFFNIFFIGRVNTSVVVLSRTFL